MRPIGDPLSAFLAKRVIRHDLASMAHDDTAGENPARTMTATVSRRQGTE
jgi:hypothetical protein